MNLIGEIGEVFIKTCQSGDLLQISYALDGFYEVFSENFYDEALQKQNVIQLMESGKNMLYEMYKSAKKEK